MREKCFEQVEIWGDQNKRHYLNSIVTRPRGFPKHLYRTELVSGCLLVDTNVLWLVTKAALEGDTRKAVSH